MTLSYHALAPLDAALNGLAGLLLVAGFAAIRRGRVRLHRLCMLSALGVSLAFLVSYLVYHYHVGDVRFAGQGWMRPLYFAILISHTTLAAALAPLVALTLVRALRGRFRAHRRLARWTWPVWVYVSLTGVVVYLLVYRLYPPAALQAIAPASAAQPAR